MQKRIFWLTAGALCVMALALAASSASAAKPRSAPIRLLAGTFNPSQGETLSLEPDLIAPDAEASASGYFILQFKGAVREHWKQQLATQGVEFLDYIPDNAFKVRMNVAQANGAKQSPNVGWVGAFQPGYKLSPDLKRGAQNAYTVRIEEGANVAAAVAAIQATGAQISGGDEDILHLSASSEQVNAIAHVADVAWIENYVLPIKHNEYGGGVIIGANTANSNGYDGSTQIAAVADTGLGDGTPAGAHPDIPVARIVAINNWPGKADICFATVQDDGARDVDSGHGTHTSGSVLSDGGASGEGKGVAPAAKLVFQASENWATLTPLCQSAGEPTAGYFLTGLPDKLKKLFQQAYSAGARVHSNSWGSSVAGDYTANSRQVDQFVWKKRDMTVTFSNGNSGVDNNNDGVVDLGSVGAPATAKNVISVGASENDRQGHWECDTSLGYQSHDLYQPNKTCNDMGGQNILGTAGQRWGFTANPLKDDVSAGNAEQMAPFSSRGPADDGRIKPDLVAPGTWILSASQNLYQEGYGDPINPKLGDYAWDGWGMPRNEFYKYMGGTSMSNPLLAGAAVLVRDYYQKEHSLNASAALVKATLINSAHDELDENNDGANDNDFPIPNNHEGWGRVDVAAATDGQRKFVEEGAGLATKAKKNFTYNVGAGATFKVTLVWSDYPSTEVAALNLVNNLNLVVISPSGKKYKGNLFANGWSKTGGKADKVNNVENVFIQSAESGAWRVQVKGSNVPYGPQPFALVVSGTQ